jgi:hypothetical protein
MEQLMKKLKGNVSFLIGSLLLFSACEVKKYPDVNTDVNQGVFTNAMVDLLILESYYTINYKKDSISPEEIDSISKLILKKYNLSVEDFANAQNEYIKNPKLYLEIQENVLEKIQIEKDSLDKITLSNLDSLKQSQNNVKSSKKISELKKNKFKFFNNQKDSLNKK